MEYRLLGPIEVWHDDRPLALGGAKQRALLVDLLLHANHVVPSERLLEDLWGGGAGEGTSHELQVYVSRLRKALRSGAGDGDVLRTRPPGYELVLQHGDTLDAERFERLVHEGRAYVGHDPAAALERFERALALWRGPALGDLSSEPFASGPAERLEELRRATLEDRLQAMLDLGRHAEVAAEAPELVAEHPLRERLWAQLMLGLYRCGRQAESLAAYHEARERLGEELGIDPGPELTRLHERILAQDPDLDLTAPVVGEEPRRRSTPGPIQAPRHPLPIGDEADVRKTVTLLWLEVEGSAPMGEVLRSEQLREVLAVCWESVRDLVDLHSGVVERLIGDSFVAVFGVPRLHEDDAIRAIRAAVGIRDSIRDLSRTSERQRGITLLPRIGVDTGDVIVGDPATGSPLVAGAAVNAAADLAKRAQPGDILIGSSAGRLIRDMVKLEPLPTEHADAGSENATVFRVLEMQVDASRAENAARSPMVGRQRELALLGDAFGSVVRGRTCHLLTVVGEPGVGKSRLIAEAVHTMEGAQVLKGRCLAYGDGITYWPIIEIVTGAAGLTDEDPADAIRSKIADVCAGGAEPELTTERLVQILGVAGATAAPDETFWAITQLFRALAQRAPTVIVIEDLHWAEPTLLDLVEHVTERLRDAPMLLLTAARPELLDERPAWARALDATLLELGPLSEVDADELLAHLLRGAGGGDLVKSRIETIAEGNPLFMEQLVAAFTEQGLVDPGGQLADETLRDPETPPSITAILGARLDRLPPDERATLERGAIEGRVFHAGAVIAMTPEHERADTWRNLLALTRRGFIGSERSLFTGDQAFRFQHILVRDAAEHRLPLEDVAELHERCADWLESAAGQRVEEIGVIIGYHLERAVLLRRELRPGEAEPSPLAKRAADHLAAAGRASRMRGDLAAASELLGRAVGLRGDDDPSLLRDLDERALADDALGRLEDALAGWERHLAEARRRGDLGGEATARCRLAFLRELTEPHRVTYLDLHDEAERSIDVFGRLHDHAGLAESWRYLALAEWVPGMNDSAMEAFEHAADEAELAGRRTEVMTCRQQALTAGFFGSVTPIEGIELCERLAAEPGLPRMDRATVISIEASFLALQGRFDRARELSDQACAMAAEMSERLVETTDGQFRADIELLAGDLEAAESLRRRGVQVALDAGDVGHASTFIANLAGILCELGRFDEALDEAGRAIEMAESRDIGTHAEALRAIARARAGKGQLTQALDPARESVAMSENIQWPDLQAGIRIDVAPIFAHVGQPDLALHLAAAAVRFCEQKGNVVRLDRAQKVLDEIRRQ